MHAGLEFRNGYGDYCVVRPRSWSGIREGQISGFLCGHLSHYPLLLTLVGVWRPMLLAGETGALAIFVAFATLIRTVAVFFLGYCQSGCSPFSSHLYVITLTTAMRRPALALVTTVSLCVCSVQQGIIERGSEVIYSASSEVAGVNPICRPKRKHQQNRRVPRELDGGSRCIARQDRPIGHR